MILYRYYINEQIPEKVHSFLFYFYGYAFTDLLGLRQGLL